MLKAFKNYISETGLFKPLDKILLGVSGGIDSMVMAYLFKASDFNFGIAHCNFQLRGKESEEDATFVKKIAEEWGVPFHSTAFNTIEESKKQQKSKEMMARDLRYDWFRELLQEFDYQFIATAHHLNDSLEPLLFNLTKGTGIRGLHGIPVQNGQIIRPLSFLSQQEIINYALAHQISYREDATNASLEHH